MNESDLHETHTRPVLACLGVASRFRLVRALAVADRCVGELAEAVGVSQSCTTRHLQALERVGLVKGRREGRRVRFRLRAEAPAISELLGWALSGAGLEALASGRVHPVNRSAPALAGLPARPALTKAADVPMAEPESDGLAGPLHHENRDSPAVSGFLRARRPNDLEDYLL
jgi:ArsR family transcriptional regulator, virulence genes transcriptional regulator